MDSAQDRDILLPRCWRSLYWCFLQIVEGRVPRLTLLKQEEWFAYICIRIAPNWSVSLQETNFYFLLHYDPYHFHRYIRCLLLLWFPEPFWEYLWWSWKHLCAPRSFRDRSPLFFITVVHVFEAFPYCYFRDEKIVSNILESIIDMCISIMFEVFIRELFLLSILSSLIF